MAGCYREYRDARSLASAAPLRERGARLNGRAGAARYDMARDDPERWAHGCAAAGAVICAGYALATLMCVLGAAS